MADVHHTYRVEMAFNISIHNGIEQQYYSTDIVIIDSGESIRAAAYPDETFGVDLALDTHGYCAMMAAHENLRADLRDEDLHFNWIEVLNTTIVRL